MLHNNTNNIKNTSSCIICGKINCNSSCSCAFDINNINIFFEDDGEQKSLKEIKDLEQIEDIENNEYNNLSNDPNFTILIQNHERHIDFINNMEKQKLDSLYKIVLYCYDMLKEVDKKIFGYFSNYLKYFKSFETIDKEIKDLTLKVEDKNKEIENLKKKLKKSEKKKKRMNIRYKVASSKIRKMNQIPVNKENSNNIATKQENISDFEVIENNLVSNDKTKILYDINKIDDL